MADLALLALALFLFYCGVYAFAEHLVRSIRGDR